MSGNSPESGRVKRSTMTPGARERNNSLIKAAIGGAMLGLSLFGASIPVVGALFGAALRPFFQTVVEVLGAGLGTLIGTIIALRR